MVAINQDRRITVHKIRIATGLTTGTIYRIFTTDLGLKKTSACWATKLLNSEREGEL